MPLYWPQEGSEKFETGMVDDGNVIIFIRRPKKTAAAQNVLHENALTTLAGWGLCRTRTRPQRDQNTTQEPEEFSSTPPATIVFKMNYFASRPVDLPASSCMNWSTALSITHLASAYLRAFKEAFIKPVEPGLSIRFLSLPRNRAARIAW